MPTVTNSQAPENLIYIALPVWIDPKDVSKAINDNFTKDPINVDVHRVHVRNTEIVIDSSKLKIGADVEAASGFLAKKLKGRLYLEGSPTIDATSKLLLISNLDYTVKTKDALTKTANWLLQPAIVGELKKRAVYFFGPDIERAKRELTSAVPRLINDPRITLDLAVRDLAANNLRLDGGQIFLVATADGSASIKLHP